MAEWQINSAGLDVTKVTLSLSDDNTKVTVSDGGTTFDSIDISGEALAIEVEGGELFRRVSSDLPPNAWKTTAEPEDGNISIDIKNTGAQGGATRWFFIIGEGDIRNGLTMEMHSIDGRKVELLNSGKFTVSRH